MANENVLTVVEDGKLIHIGDPLRFNSEFLIEYCRRGCKIETFTLDEFKLSGWKLYEAVPAFPSPGWVSVEEGNWTEEQIIAAAHEEITESKFEGEEKTISDRDYVYMGFLRSVIDRLKTAPAT